MTRDTTPLLQGVEVAKQAILTAAEAEFAELLVPFRPGRMARLVGKTLHREGEQAAWLLMRHELDTEYRRLHKPGVRTHAGIADPTGALAAARVDADRLIHANKKNAPSTVAAVRGENQNTNR